MQANTTIPDTAAATTLYVGARAFPVPPGVEYHRVLAGSKRRIGRGILAIALLLIGMVVFGWLTSQGAVLIDTAMGRTNPTDGGTDVTPAFQAGNMVALALLVPWSMAIQRWLYNVPGASLHSVASRFRFDLFGRAILFAGPLWVLVIVLSAVPGKPVMWNSGDLIGMFVVTMLITPLQAAGEEYGLRGLVFRVAGSWTSGRRSGLLLGMAISSLIFVAIHLSPDPWHNLYYLAPAVSFAIITWRTGGLEVAVVVHALNNLMLFLFNIVMHAHFPSLQERSSEGGSALQLIPAGAVLELAGVVWVATRRAGPALTRIADG